MPGDIWSNPVISSSDTVHLDFDWSSFSNAAKSGGLTHRRLSYWCDHNVPCWECPMCKAEKLVDTFKCDGGCKKITWHYRNKCTACGVEHKLTFAEFYKSKRIK